MLRDIVGGYFRIECRFLLQSFLMKIFFKLRSNIQQITIFADTMLDV